ncbi:helix-turn-helix domain-containing protein [Nocardia concava]|uniref:helix-turn-helix domain-containing protein n=1 Tax=Nocardia concava TaxID=257281 RepID=UPI0002F52CC4|nr:XRE family transcriptional regulator [Nocardia concava]
MSPARNWRDIKAEAHHLHPELADPAVRAEASAQLDAYVAGYHLEELRKTLGKPQSEIAVVLGVSQSRVSQIENGDLGAMELDTLRAYAEALGGRVEITLSVGPHTIKVA